MFPNKYIVYAGLVILSIAIFGTYMVVHDNAIRQQAMLEANNKQLEKIIEDQNKFFKTINAINETQKQIISDMNQKNDQLTSQLKDLNDYLNSDEANKDSRPSSKVLQNTFKELMRKK
ncbi:hypothetical protein UFOVP787_52 [uncultured Caudovirales phage]|uniref:Uncharacterized protein n=1 Tax=uncultured Caudovirales phage TaxID=2100421 RepID=A0A6J5NXW1_9CAUD|nr:hypothetical protein UFOVP787_52 [uncultured Caudovirales phage]